MKQKTLKTKKTPKQEAVDIVRTSIERIADALEDIALSLKLNKSMDDLVDAQMELQELEKSDYITFPSKTAQQIVEECNNSIAGGKLLYSTWLEKEDFYTKETCRPRTVKIPTEILHPGKSWNECKELIGEDNMFNFAEIMYMLRECESFRKLLSWEGKSVYYTWTNSRDSDGRLLYVGLFDSDGSSVNDWHPRDSDSSMGVCFSRSE